MSSDYQHKGRKRRSLERKVSAHSSEERERERRRRRDERRGETNAGRRNKGDRKAKLMNLLQKYQKLR